MNKIITRYSFKKYVHDIPGSTEGHSREYSVVEYGTLVGGQSSWLNTRVRRQGSLMMKLENRKLIVNGVSQHF
jgi:hypothetical protein